MYPNKKVCSLVYLCFFGFLMLQLFITFDISRNWYPFSPYRMFSKNWTDSIVMERIRYRNLEGQFFFPWELIRVPFFQANQMSFAVFMDLNDPAAKKELCHVLNVPHLKVIREHVQYNVSAGKMDETIKTQEIIYECAK